MWPTTTSKAASGELITRLFQGTKFHKTSNNCSRSIRGLSNELSTCFTRFTSSRLEADESKSNHIDNLCKTKIREYLVHQERRIISQEYSDLPVVFKFMRKAKRPGALHLAYSLGDGDPRNLALS